MHRKVLIAIAAAVLALAALLAVVKMQPMRNPGAAPERITIAVAADPSSALIFIAREKAFFAAEGVDVSLVMHSTGKAALSSMERGKAQLATVADTVLMFAGMNKRPVSAVASLSESSMHHRIVGLLSSGIRTPYDLRGKRIGVTLRTTSEFFLYTFLLFRGIPVSDVTLVDLQPENMRTALQEGVVDAVAVFFPTVTSIETKLRGRVVSFADDNYLMAWNLVAPNAFIRDHRDAVTRTLRALIRAERFLSGNPDASIDITSRMSGSEPAVLKHDWSNYRFEVRLTESLLIDLEDQARWALKVYYPERRAIPDFTEYVSPSALKSVEPAAVGILERGYSP